MLDGGTWRRRLEAVLGVPATEGNQVDVLRNGVEIFPAMLDAIAGARRSVDLVTFIYWQGSIAEKFAVCLAERAQAGVRVRVLLDAVGSRLISDDLVDLMTDAGCDVRWFRPVADGSIGEAVCRTHRKLLVCDETVSFTGGVGIADEWDGDASNEDEWRDTHFRIVGPATDGLRSGFLHNWAETGADRLDPAIDLFPPLAASGPSTLQVVRSSGEPGGNDVRLLFEVLVESASTRLRVTTAYFTPDDAMVERLVAARRRGVRVQVLVPGPHADKRFIQLAGESVFAPLLDAGVEVASFQTSMLHAKIITVDETIAVVGSANMNSRSMHFDDELDVVIFDAPVVATLDRHFEEDLERSEDLDPQRWAERGLLQRAQETVVDAVSDLL